MFEVYELDSGYSIKFYDKFKNYVYITLSENTVLIEKDNYIVFFDGYLYDVDISNEILFRESISKEILKRFGCFTVIIINKIEYTLTVYSDSLGLAQSFMYSDDKNCYYISYNIKNFKKILGIDVRVDLREIIRNPWFSGIPKNDRVKRDIFIGITDIAFGQIVEFFAIDVLDVSFLDKENFYELQSIEDNLDEVQESYEKTLDSSLASFKSKNVALLLSGGIDSVTVGKMLDDYQIDYFPVTLVSKSTLSNEDVLYSLNFAKHQNKNCKMIELLEEMPLLSVEQYKNLLTICESPFVGAEQIYKYLLYYSINENFTNVEFIATGQGSDEFNGGYSSTAGEDWEDFNNLMAFLDVHASVEDSYIWTERFRDNIFNTSDNLFEEYTKGKLSNFLYYSVWNEIRIAKCFGFKIFSPFLHIDFYNLTKVISSHLQKELYFDKKILRNYAEKIGVPNEFVKRKKVPFFHGSQTNSTFKNLFNIINQDSRRLVYDAFKDDELNNVISLSKIIKILDDMNESNDYSNIEYILKLINVGLINQFLCEDQPVKNDIKSVKVMTDETQFISNYQLLKTKNNRYNLSLSDDSEILFSHDFMLISILKEGLKLFEVEKDCSQIFYDLLVELECNGEVCISMADAPEIISWIEILLEEKVLVERENNV